MPENDDITQIEAPAPEPEAEAPAATPIAAPTVVPAPTPARVECGVCHQMFLPSMTDEPQKNTDGEILCQRCVDNGTVCSECDKIIAGEPIIEGDAPKPGEEDERKLLCRGCAVCSGCGNEVDEIVRIDGDIVCDDCYGKCASCGDLFKQDDLRGGPDNEVYCEACFDDKFYYCEHCGEAVEQKDYLTSEGRRSRRGGVNGCNECCIKCEECGFVEKKDDMSGGEYNDDYYCGDCFSDKFSICETCNDTYPSEDMTFTDDGSYCSDCFKEKYFKCKECDEIHKKDDAVEIDDELYCEDCAEKVKPSIEKFYGEYIENVSELTYTTKDRFLDKIKHQLPLSIADFKSIYPQLAAPLRDLVALAQGGEITEDLVEEYRKSLTPETFDIVYSGERDNDYRSIGRLEAEKVSDELLERPQLIMHILDKNGKILAGEYGDSLSLIFVNVNRDQHLDSKELGTVFLEINENEKYILVDDIHNTHQEMAYNLKYMGDSEEANTSILRRAFRLVNTAIQSMPEYSEEMPAEAKVKLKEKLIDAYIKAANEFPNVATEAILKFARENGFNRIYWHTPETAKDLARSPSSPILFTSVPKKNFYVPTDDKPFGLPGNFLRREASETSNPFIRRLHRFSRAVQLKRLLNKNGI